MSVKRSSCRFESEKTGTPLNIPHFSTVTRMKTFFSERSSSVLFLLTLLFITRPRWRPQLSCSDRRGEEPKHLEGESALTWRDKAPPSRIFKNGSIRNWSRNRRQYFNQSLRDSWSFVCPSLRWLILVWVTFVYRLFLFTHVWIFAQNVQPTGFRRRWNHFSVLWAFQISGSLCLFEASASAALNKAGCFYLFLLSNLIQLTEDVSRKKQSLKNLY